VNALGFKSFALIFLLSKTKGKSKVRQSILDYIKSFISNIDSVRDFEITMKKRSIDIGDKRFSIHFDSQKTFKMGFITFDEKILGTINTILNEISSKLNEFNEEKAKSEMILAFTLEYEIEERSKPFSKIINKKTLKRLSQSRILFEPVDIEIMGVEEGKEKVFRFRISTEEAPHGHAEEEKALLEISQVDILRDQFPVNITMKALADSKKFLNKVMTVLVGEKR